MFCVGCSLFDVQLVTIWQTKVFDLPSARRIFSFNPFSKCGRAALFANGAATAANHKRSTYAIYALWNNKGGVGKSYLTFQIAAGYAKAHPELKVLVLDMCPQANASSMLLGGMQSGESALDELGMSNPRCTIAGYIRDRVTSPYQNPRTGASYLIKVRDKNQAIAENLYLVPGDEELEVLASRVSGATRPGPDDAWARVHLWLSDLISDVAQSWNVNSVTTFIDCNPSFGIYTELAMSASDRLIIPFSADGSSKRAVRAVLSLIYGKVRSPGGQQSEFYLNSERWRMKTPRIYCYVGNRLTTSYKTSASAFRTVVNEIGNEIFAVWQASPGAFSVHPSGSSTPANRNDFKKMFQFEVRDANTASVVSGALGIPILSLWAGQHVVVGKSSTVNQSQLEAQQPNIQELIGMIE
jgi:cellulose biosynthesis protein BcsQ